MRKTFILFLLVFFVIVVSLSAQLSEEEILNGEVEIEKKFEKAKMRFNSLEQAESIFDFNQIIVLLEANLQQKTITERQMSILKKSYEFRARAYFNNGDDEKSKTDIKLLLKFDIDYMPSRESSVKFQKTFQRLKKLMTGYFSVTTKPQGARIYVDGRFIGLSNTPVLKHRIGHYPVKAELNGYSVAESSITVNSRKTTKVVLNLTRVSASLSIQTVPSGVEVFLNDKKIGITSDKAGPEQRRDLDVLGIDPENCSAWFEIPDIKPGTIQLRLSKACYQDLIAKLELKEALDYNLEPFILKTSQGRIMLENVSPDAEVYLNGLLQGKGNQDLKNLCTGLYKVLVRYPDGKYLKQFRLHKDETVIVTPSIKPTVLYGGVVSLDGSLNSGELSDKIRHSIEQIESLNVYFPTPKDQKDVSELGRLPREITGGLKASEDFPLVLTGGLETRKIKLLEKFDSDLLFIVKVLDQDRAAAILFHASHPAADVALFSISPAGDKQHSIKRVVSRLEDAPPVLLPWLGISVVETEIGEGLLVSEVVDGSPAAKAGIKCGDMLVFLASRRMTDLRRYSNTLAMLKISEKTTAKISKDGKLIDVSIVPGVTPVTPQYCEGERFYNRLLADIESGRKGVTLKRTPSIATYLKAVLYYYLGSYDKAQHLLVGLKGVKSDYLNPGLVRLFLSLTYEKMGDRASSQAERIEYLKHPEARLFDNSGTPISLIDRYQIYP